MNYKTFDLEDWIAHINEAIEDERGLDGNEMRDLVAFLSKMPSSKEPNKWIPLIKRPMTEEEREEYKEMTGITETMILNCPLPEDGEEVFISYGGYVCVDTFHDDDGCYFEDVEIDEVDAWMPLPNAYKESEDKQ